MINICVVGAMGAFGRKHCAAIKTIDKANLYAIVGGANDDVQSFAKEHNIPHAFKSLTHALKDPKIDAIILVTPTPLHAKQAMDCLKAGKHVLVEIPMADNFEDAKSLYQLAQKTPLISMAGHVRRYNPSHQWIHNRVQKSGLRLQHLNVQTYFFRRENKNALGETRDWTDHLLWHHAAHTIDLFQYQTGEEISSFHVLEGPHHPELGIAMDMSIGLKTPSGALCTLTLSFNNDGPLGTDFRYICDNGTYIARYDDLIDGHGNTIELSQTTNRTNGIELIDLDFINAIRTKKEPNASVTRCFSTMEIINALEKSLKTQRH